jgi:hypothetical protein
MKNEKFKIQNIKLVIIIIDKLKINKQIKFEKINEMQNNPYPFQQNEHIFDFKVKVNF